MLRLSTTRPIYFSRFTHPHTIMHTGPALSWGRGGLVIMGSSIHAHVFFMNTGTRPVPLIFPTDGLLF